MQQELHRLKFLHFYIATYRWHSIATFMAEGVQYSQTELLNVVSSSFMELLAKIRAVRIFSINF